MFFHLTVNEQINFSSTSRKSSKKILLEIFKKKWKTASEREIERDGENNEKAIIRNSYEHMPRFVYWDNERKCTLYTIQCTYRADALNKFKSNALDAHSIAMKRCTFLNCAFVQSSYDAIEYERIVIFDKCIILSSRTLNLREFTTTVLPLLY